MEKSRPFKIPACLVLLVFAAASLCQAKLSPLAPRPDWSRLDPYQGTMTRETFLSLLENVYAPGGAWKDFVDVSDDGAIIRTAPGRPPYQLRFAADGAPPAPIPSTWRSRSALQPPPPGKPLAGLRIAIDPGHIGGSWAKVEERWFRIGNSAPVTEGDMTLKVAKLLVPRLTAMGAQVYLTRSKPAPVTNARPGQLRAAAVESLRDKGEAVNSHSVTKESERLFYRASEIRHRARLVNESIRPDLVLCLHFNAEDWGNEKNARLVAANHLHFLVTGSWGRKELEYEDQRLELFVKLLSRSFGEELRVTDAISRSMASATGLPPYRYEGSSAVRVNSNPYIWARNLLANRLFACPVVYVEPYVMNNASVFARIQAGDYEGRRRFGKSLLPSIYREYADAIAAGLASYYSHR